MEIVNVLVLVSLGYVAFLFLVAFAADRAAQMGHARWLHSPLIYTLSLSIYCTAWTFYGAVGFAARSGLEFVTIYLGPTLVMIGWWWTLRKMVRVGRSQRVTSIADLLSSRFGKSNTLAVFVTIFAVIGTTPYIALQLQSVTLSYAAFAEAGRPDGGQINEVTTSFWVAAGLAIFTILFGTRNLDANERHHGLVMAIALEAIVKLFALLAVGIFVVWSLGGGLTETLARIDASTLADFEVPGSRWVGLTLLSAAAFMCLPRMFQVLVVENEHEGHLRTASWAFPAYLMLMSLFVVPIAAIGLDLMPAGANPDMFVLTLPLMAGQEGLAILSFLGGFSSATSMVIVAAIALSTMVSNHVVMPVWLWMTGDSAVMSGDVRQVALRARRLSIAVILFLGYLYFRLSGGGAALAAIGLISFVGVAQFLPALVGGLLWRGANRRGALAGLAVGFAIWAFCLFLPSFGPSAILPQTVLDHGAWGIGAFRPQALFGVTSLDPVVHAFMWSLSFNTLVFVTVSLVTFPEPAERLQGAQFVNVFDHSAPTSRGWSAGMAQSEDLLIMAQRIMGAREAQALFSAAARDQALAGNLPETTPDFLARLERALAGSVGAATAHAMISQIVGRAVVSVQDLMAVADETAQIMEYSSRLEAKTEEQERTARQLRQANDKLTQISVQKDAFLSQISHELRTPMTSIRAFSEILREGGLSKDESAKYATIIHDEAIRLTRLLDDLLDLSVLENAQIVLNLQQGQLYELLDRAIAAAGLADGRFKVTRDTAREQIELYTDLDRLSQVFINVIANSGKYCDVSDPRLSIDVSSDAEGRILVDFNDNGPGIPADKQATIFEKFARVSETKAGGAGLGLAICREIMTRLGGGIAYMPGQSGASFRVTIPAAEPVSVRAAQ